MRSPKVAWSVLLIAAGAGIVVGGHDVLLGGSWGGRAAGVLAVAVGAWVLTAVCTGMTQDLRVGARSAVGASVVVLVAAIAILGAQVPSGAERTWRGAVPIAMILIAAAAMVSVRRRNGVGILPLAERALRRPVGRALAFSAALLSLLQLAAAFWTSTPKAPVRPLINVAAQLEGNSVTVTIRSRNMSGADLPVLADLVNVVAMNCPRPASVSGARLIRREQRIRALHSSPDVSALFNAAELGGCDKAKTLDTGSIVGETAFVASRWSSQNRVTYDFPSGTNTICAFASLGTIDFDMHRLGVVDAGTIQPDQTLQYRYKLEPAGWLDALVNVPREVLVEWTQAIRTNEGALYHVPNETISYLVNRREKGTDTFAGPGPISTVAWDCDTTVRGSPPTRSSGH